MTHRRNTLDQTATNDVHEPDPDGRLAMSLLGIVVVLLLLLVVAIAQAA